MQGQWVRGCKGNAIILVNHFRIRTYRKSLVNDADFKWGIEGVDVFGKCHNLIECENEAHVQQCMDQLSSFIGRIHVIDLSDL